MPTENHRYNTPEKGTANWHRPLNSNFETFDTDIEIRDVEGNLSDYIPKTNAKFLAHDTGNIYHGDGSTWNRVPIRGSSVQAHLEVGNIVGATPRDVHPVDPSSEEFDTHDAAIQDAITRIQDGSNPGYVYIPAVPAGADHITIENTVTFDGDAGTSVLPMGIGFQTQSAPYIDTTIDDGSPMFHLKNIRSLRTPMGNVKVSAPGQDAEFIRMTKVTEPQLEHCEVRGLGTKDPSAAGAYVIDSECYNGLVFSCAYNQRGGNSENPSVGGMNAFAARDDLGTDAPGEMQFIGLNTYADPSNPFRAGYHSEANASNMMFAFGRFEGAQEAHFDIDSGGQLAVGAPFQMGRTENGGHGIDFDGYKLTVATGVWSGGTIDGHGINFSPGQGVIGFVNLNCNGDDVVVTANPGEGDKVTVPDPAALQGSANYPSGASDVHVVQTDNPS